MRLTKTQKLVSSLLITFIVAAIGSIFTIPSIETWYLFLQKPAFTPPNWIFGPIWTALYLMMGLSFYLVWKKKAKKRQLKRAFEAYFAQLALNLLWSIAFFGFRSLFGGVLIISALWASILVTIYRFYKIDKKATYLLIPYIFWVSAASFLNCFLWILNI